MLGPEARAERCRSADVARASLLRRDRTTGSGRPARPRVGGLGRVELFGHAAGLGNDSLEPWRKSRRPRDPVQTVKNWLLDQAGCTDEEVKALELSVRREIEAAVEEAKAARDNLRFWEVHARKQLTDAKTELAEAESALQCGAQAGGTCSQAGVLGTV